MVGRGGENILEGCEFRDVTGAGERFRGGVGKRGDWGIKSGR